MARYLFRMEWWRKKPTEIHGYLVSLKTGKRASNLPEGDYILVKRTLNKQTGWQICSSVRMEDWSDRLVYKQHPYVDDSYDGKTGFRYLSDAKDWCDRDQRRENWTRC